MTGVAGQSACTWASGEGDLPSARSATGQSAFQPPMARMVAPRSQSAGGASSACSVDTSCSASARETGQGDAFAS